MRDKEAVVARNISAVMARKKMIAGTLTNVLIELRDEGVLGTLDLGVGTTRRDKPNVNLQKFTLIHTSLKRAVSEGDVLMENDGFWMTLGAPHVKPIVHVQAEPTVEARMPHLSAAILTRLRMWGWGELDEMAF